MQPLLVWLLASLLAIALMGSRPYLALTVVLVGGIAMGLSSLVSYFPPGQEGSGGREHSTDGSLPFGQ